MGPRDASVLRLRIVIRPESVLMVVKPRVTERLTAIAMRLPFVRGQSLFRTGRLIATTAEIRPRTEVRTAAVMPSPFVLRNARMGEILRRMGLKIATVWLRQTAIWRMFASMVGSRKETEHRGVAVLRLRIAVLQKSVRWVWEVKLNQMGLKHVYVQKV